MAKFELEQPQVRNLVELQELAKHIIPVSNNILVVPPIINPKTPSGIIKSQELIEAEQNAVDIDFLIIDASEDTLKKYPDCVGKKAIVKATVIKEASQWRKYYKETGVNIILIADYAIAAFVND